MRPFAIVADVTCDLPEKFQKEYDVTVVPGHLVLPDGSDVKAYVNWDVMPRDEFYADLKKRPSAYATSPANPDEFAEVFEKIVSEGKDILAMTISGAMSGAFSFAQKGADAVLSRHPEARIKVIDTMRFGPGFGLMAVHASMKRAEGKSFEEVADYIESNKNRFHQAGWLDDLSFVAKKGRLTHAKAFFGTLAGIKPIGEFDYNGMTTVIGKIRGTKPALEALVDYIEKTIEDPEDQIIFIAQTNRLPQAEEYKKLIEEKIRPKAVFINDVYHSCGVNIGPGLMAAYYVGKPITHGLSEEKAIIEAFQNKGE